MGGFGTWDLLARRPDLFAAAVPICGGGDETTAAKIAKIPIWAFHGAKDATVKVSRTRNMIEALKKAGGDAEIYGVSGRGPRLLGPGVQGCGDDEVAVRTEEGVG